MQQTRLMIFIPLAEKIRDPHKSNMEIMIDDVVWDLSVNDE
jgi:hypothetical protein